ncbi:glycoside hydrolase family 3 C-terminal domain-containing protein [Novosphingobium sp. 1949]|uniref:Glycoside hydrolase family 3 C-terminal domain-containing protein n=2 Tax=Novosphingobium organovorum TaxID=2930092 RepID=A0ABT0BBM7_9SPHN|nr:glycoside hydrolase family 3 C-terminal domain-containing protein [Novosphingobium organovorum]
MGVRVKGVERTALPSSLAIAASFDPRVAYLGGQMIADEARATGFNVLLAGGANLAREPRNGRNFEYAGEDPLLAATMVSGQINGIQSRHMISTFKHYALNDQESQRTTLDAKIDDKAMRQSDLLAFELLIERSDPGSAMCGYNLVNGDWACENDHLLTGLLKGDFGFKGYVMSDWGAVHSSHKAAMAGLDQQTGYDCCGGDHIDHFGRALRADLMAGITPMARLDDMVRRILRAMVAKGLLDDQPKVGPIDFAAHAQVALRAAEASMVLLKNDGDLLPLNHAASIVIIGGHADVGVLSGAGSSAVYPVGGNAAPGVKTPWGREAIYMPSSPLASLRQMLPKAQIDYDAGTDATVAAKAAAAHGLAIVFVNQWSAEEHDHELALPGNQDALITAVAAANPHTVVVLENGGALYMPWLGQVPAVLEAWYPGIRGGQAIAEVLTGKINPSGRLPISFPAGPEQLAHATIAGMGEPDKTPVSVTYDEGATIGYKWYEEKGLKPLFAFGHGLSYTRFEMGEASAKLTEGALRLSAEFRNVGGREGGVTPQFYVKAPGNAGWEAPRRLVGFEPIALTAGASGRAQTTVDNRLLATYDPVTHSWNIATGDYEVWCGEASDKTRLIGTVHLAERRWPASQATPQEGT